MKHILLLLLLLFTLWGGVSYASVDLYDLKCENLRNPNAIDNTTPHFSWKVKSTKPMKQACYEIEVASAKDLLKRDRVDFWKSGKIKSSESVMIPYAGKQLSSRDLLFWRVRVYNDKGENSEWSKIQRFGIGIVGGDVLRGEYIGLGKDAGNVVSPMLRKSFSLKKVSTSFLHVNSLGYHEVYVNGEKVSEDVLSPAISQINKRTLIVTYDVTDYLKKGQNDIVIWLGQGWYKKTTFGADYDGPLVKAQLDMLDKSDWKPIIATDNTWQGKAGGYSDTGSWQAISFGGERIDARLLAADLSKAGLDKLEWGNTIAIDVTDMKVSPQMCMSNKKKETITPKKIYKSYDGSWIIDLGKVITGWFEIKLPNLPEGHEVWAHYTDDIKLDPRFSDHKESDVYISNGKSENTFCNKFNHHAYRYVKLTGLDKEPSIEDVKGYLIHGDYQSASTFECSDSDMNAIHDMIKYTMSCLTYSGYMVDCPHIERAGYGGDGNSSTVALQTMYDVSPTFMNWVQAWSDAMREGGSLPHIAPNPGAGGGGPYWCGFYVLASWRTYADYRDARLVERYYEQMKEWFKYVDKYTVDGLLKRWPDTKYRDWYLGDWLAPWGVDTGNPASIDLVSNCLVSECLSAMQNMAIVLGKTDEAADFAKRRDRLNKIIHETYYNVEESIYSAGSQLDMSYPTLVGVVPAELHDKVSDKLIELTVTKYTNHLGVGLVGVPILTEWAVQNEKVDFMYNLLKQPDYPGYLNMINHDATTTWEYWSGERSRVHNCYNGIGTWFYQAVGGIVPDQQEAGYKHFYINPQVADGMTWAKTTKESPYGTIRVDWKMESDKQLNMFVVIPIGSEATLIVPKNAISGKVDSDGVDLSSGELNLKNGVHEITFEL